MKPAPEDETLRRLHHLWLADCVQAEPDFCSKISQLGQRRFVEGKSSQPMLCEETFSSWIWN